MDSSTLFDGAFHRTQAMARSLGLNLTTAVAQRHLDIDVPPKMMAACHHCGFADACVAWLSDCRPEAPDFCANKSILDRLARLTA